MGKNVWLITPLTLLLVSCAAGSTPTAPDGQQIPSETSQAQATDTTVAIAVTPGETTTADIYMTRAATTTPAPNTLPTLTSTPTQTPIPALAGSGGGVIAIASDRLGLAILNGDGTQPTLLDGKGVTLSWSPDGQWLAYGIPEEDGSGAEIYKVKTDGTGQMNLTTNPASDREPAWSPDGTQIAFVSDRDGGQDLYVMDADGARQTRLTTHMEVSTEAGWEEVDPPAWSPDGRKIAFVSGSDSPGIYAVDVSSGDLAYLSRDVGGGRDPNWSPDGQKIAFVNNRDIYVMNSDGNEKTNLTNNPANDWEPDWSPDGRRIVFSSDRNCCENPTDRISELHVMNADGSGVTRLSRYTGHFGIDLAPDWSPDGKRIACVASGWEAEKEWFVINADGSGRTSLYYDGRDFKSPRLAWRPK